MSQAIKAIYENGCLRPLESLPLKEGDHVSLRLEVPNREAKKTLEVLDDLLESCAEMTEEQWAVFDEAE